MSVCGGPAGRRILAIRHKKPSVWSGAEVRSASLVRKRKKMFACG